MWRLLPIACLALAGCVQPQLAFADELPPIVEVSSTDDVVEVVEVMPDEVSYSEVPEIEYLADDSPEVVGEPAESGPAEDVGEPEPEPSAEPDTSDTAEIEAAVADSEPEPEPVVEDADTAPAVVVMDSEQYDGIRRALAYQLFVSILGAVFGAMACGVALWRSAVDR